MTPEAERRLLEAVAAHPGGGCALLRLDRSLASSDALRSRFSTLDLVAAEIGMTEYEAHGIMDGWDWAERLVSLRWDLTTESNAWRHSALFEHGAFESEDGPTAYQEYLAGRTLGDRCFQLASTLEESVE